MERKRVIVVDDNETNRKILRVLLTKLGHAVLTFTQAEEALEAIEAAPPDLLLLDMHLPGMDGPALMGRLKAHPRTRAIPIIALTASYDDAGEGERQARAAGADGFLLKPITLKTFVELLRVTLEGTEKNTPAPISNRGATPGTSSSH